MLQRRLDLRERGQPARLAQHAVELPAARRRQLPARRRLGAARRLRALHDADQQRARHARRLRQPVHRLSRRPPTRSAWPTACRARRWPIRSRRPSTRSSSRTARPTAATRASAAPSASTSTSCGRRSTIASTCRTRRRSGRGIIVDASYFFNWGTRVPYDINLNMADPAFRYEQKAAAQHAGHQPVPQLPDAGQVPRPGCATPRP